MDHSLNRFTIGTGHEVTNLHTPGRFDIGYLDEDRFAIVGKFYVGYVERDVHRNAWSR